MTKVDHFNDLERKRRRQFVIPMVIVGMAVTLAFSVIDYLEGDTLEIFINAAMALTLGIGSLLIFRFNKDRLVYCVSLNLIALAIIINVSIGAGGATAIFWLYLVPLLLFIFLEQIEALISVTVFLCIAFILLLYPSLLSTYDYTLGIGFRVSLSLILITIVSFIIESSRARYSGLLRISNNELRKKTQALEMSFLDLKGSAMALSEMNKTIVKENKDRKEVEKMLQESEANYRSLFEHSPISLWEEDFSGAKQIIDHLHAQGISDFESYFLEHPEVVDKCAKEVVVLNVNQATLEMYEASDKDDLLATLDKIMSPDSMDSFRSEMVALAQGKTNYEGERKNTTVKGKIALVSVSVRIAPGYEKTWGRVYVSLLDITEKRKVELEQLNREKLQGVIETAGAACHDLNQPLQVIVGQLELMLMNSDANTKVPQERIETVLREVDRITHITRNLSQITSVKTMKYVFGENILDINSSSGG